MIRIIISPAFDHRGRRLHGRFEARLERRLVCISREPLLAASRVLLAEGVSPETPITTWHAGAAHDALRSTIGHAAKLTVRENEKDGPRFVRWESFSHRRVDAPMRSGSDRAPDTGRSPEPIRGDDRVSP